MTQRRFYECPKCRHTWAHRFPLGELTNPFTDCTKCGERSAPRGCLAWRDSFCDDCGRGDKPLAVSQYGKLCANCFSVAIELRILHTEGEDVG